MLLHVGRDNCVGVLACDKRYWAIAIPSAMFVTASMAVVVYIAVNFMSTAPLDSFDTITGSASTINSRI